MADQHLTKRIPHQRTRVRDGNMNRFKQQPGRTVHQRHHDGYPRVATNDHTQHRTAQPIGELVNLGEPTQFQSRSDSSDSSIVPDGPFPIEIFLIVPGVLLFLFIICAFIGKARKQGKKKRKPGSAKVRDSAAASVEIKSDAEGEATDRPGLVGHKQKSIFFGGKEIQIETPPKGVVIIWILIAAELVFDLVTTGIAFSVFLREPNQCCGEEIVSQIDPLYASIPFACLVVTELLFLLRAMRITLWPPQQQVEETERSIWSKIFCFLKGKKASFITFLINCLTLINPFFSFVIAWMLLHQTDEKEAYLVIGLECTTIILHFVSVHFEGGARTFSSKLLHGTIIIPFLATGLMVAWYVQQGGICYNANLQLFWYNGCEVCPGTGMPPINKTMCAYTDGMGNTEYSEYHLWELDQATKCTDGVQMCFFDESYNGESELFG